ncbi:helicase associated domain-containing protein [Marisediminicola sp. LYQ85]|uniref:helicase associated domain-containing protein n=1 Tax=Marisediminicola sp. LYQ85 TaxID=3391062 RepID=UPI0039836732
MLDRARLAAMHDHYRSQRALPPQKLTYDMRRGMLFFRAETNPLGTCPADPPIPLRVIQWTDGRQALEQHIARTGKAPANNRRPGSATRQEELTLAEWSRTQRRADRAGRLCAYQRERLDLIDLFDWDPRETAWMATFNRYARFLGEHGRAPTERRGAEERTLANWASKQRAAYWSGKLAAHHQAQLQSLPVWGWGRGPQAD